jgi:hypothetical protein
MKRRNENGAVLAETVLWLSLLLVFVMGFLKEIQRGRERLEDLQKERMAYDGVR